MLFACKSDNSAIIEVLISNGADNWEECAIEVCKTGNLSLLKLFLQKGIKNVNYILIVSLNYQNYNLANHLIRKGADIDHVNGIFQLFSIKISFQKKNFYSIIFLLFHGASFTPQIQQDCIKIIKGEKEEFEVLIRDYKNNKIWNTERNKYFSNQFKRVLFCFLVSLKTRKYKIPRFVLYLIVQQFVTLQILENEIKKKNK